MSQPILRFPEYSEELQDFCLGDIYTERKEKGNDALPMLSVSIHTGVSDGELDEEELGKKVKRSEDKSVYKKAAQNDLVFNMMRAWQGAIGVVRTTGMVSPAYIVASPNEYVFPLFMDFYLRSPQMVSKINRQSYGVMDFRKRLYWDSFTPIRCKLPSIEEQIKVTRFLELINDRINKQQEIIDDLLVERDGYLQRIFEGDLKFKDSVGNNYPSWQSVKLKELEEDKVLQIKRGNIIPKQTGRYPVYSSSSQGNGLFCYSDSYMFDEDLITWSIDGGGRVFYRPKHKFSVTNVCGYIRVLEKNTISCAYLAYNMMYEKSKLVFDYLTKAHPSVIRELYCISVPCMEEQRKIADFFEAFNARIDSEKNILQDWITIKKGLIQKMFM